MRISSKKIVSWVSAGMASFLLYPALVNGQVNNKPFAFNTPSGAPGISIGGMQAILNDKLLGVRSENMVRAPDGRLLSIMEGPGSSAIVSEIGGVFIPRYKGGSYKDGNTIMNIGAFNPYFVSGPPSSANSYMVITSGDTINTWTGRVISGAPVSYAPYNSIDTWTGMAQIHDPSN